ncbi:MAG: hypothetical protein RLZZ383_1471 [Pseudomonadota bacterium]|jgi:hypothetical protein
MRHLVPTLLLSFAFAGVAGAQEIDPVTGRPIKYAERTEIDFDDLDLKGELKKPDGLVFMDVKRGQFNPLIRLREDFNLEMKQSIDEVK